MINIEKVIKGLECCSTSGVCPEQCPYYTDDGDNCPMYLDALALLKEQPEIIRCLDCHYHDAGENESEGWNRCRLHRIPTNDDEFCSWGVKKNDWNGKGNQRA